MLVVRTNFQIRICPLKGYVDQNSVDVSPDFLLSCSHASFIFLSC